jgi:AhpD family alkylhydroperoxidase
MPFLKSHNEKSGPGDVFQAYPEIYRHWAEMGQALINGPSPLSPGEREMIQAFVAGLINCQFAYVAHTAAPVARGIEPGVVEKLVADVASAPVSAKLKPLLALVKKLALEPTQVSQSDADAVFAAGWDEQAYHSAVAVTARMTFMSKIIHGHGFVPMSPERAKANAEHRAKAGYVALYPQLAKK